MNEPMSDTELTNVSVIAKGAHTSRDYGMCVMEAVAYVAGEPHSDHPTCACPIITAFLVRWNDDLPDDATRTRLLAPLVRRVVGTRSTKAVELRRSYMALDWYIREHTPAWLDLVPSCREHAAALRALPEIVDSSGAEAAHVTLDAARVAAERDEVVRRAGGTVTP